ncbi:phage tail tape measure protein [Methylobacterium oryzae]|uniref:phage tail tape measure protein n=1 Tax=Methylobacterium oryzae TaxID=334852 RepID=UPI001F40DF37|nr:phage tail tape measure protein [Methylobacterium oryzae]UIN36386.1 phage tail tape measure protein [Methylobacterium oryzae]
MSDQNTQAKLELEVEVRAAEKVKALKSDLDSIVLTLKDLAKLKVPDNLAAKLQPNAARDALNTMNAKAQAASKIAGIEAQASRQRRADASAEAASRRMFDAADVAALKAKMGFQARMGRQRYQEDAAAERQRRAYDAAALRDFRERFAFATRMGRQRQAEARESERAEAAATRTRIAGERQVRQERERTHREAIRYGRDAFGKGRQAVREIVRPPAAVAAAGAAGAVAGTRRVLRAEGDVDAAEMNARIYGGLSFDLARKLRDQWAAPLAEALGAGTDSLLNAYTEATKVGIPAAGAQAFAELATKTSEAWSVSFDVVTDTLGTVNSILTSKGAAYDGRKLKSVANTLQYLAAKQSTTPEKLISFLKRGAGGADVLGMSMESALAFGSASTSLGNQAGQSGSLLDYIAGRVVEMPKITKGHGDQAKQARQLVGALGFGSAQAMDAKRRSNPDAFLPDLMERFSKIKDPRKQDQAIRFFAGREWLGEFGRMVKGADTYREAVKLAKESKGLDAIGQVWELHRLKLAFVFKQFRTGWLNILGEFGKVLSPMARQAGDYFLEWTVKLRAGGLQARFRAALDGLIEGLGFRNFPALLRGIFGTPGDGMAGTVESWKAFARGFGEGIRNVAATIKRVFQVFTGGDMRPETIGRLAAEILGFSVALVIAAPVVSVLTGLATGILAFAAAARGAWAIIQAMKLTPAAPGPGGAPGAAAGGGFMGWFRNLLRLAPAVAMPLTIDPSKEDSDKLTKRLGDWAKGQRRDERSTWQDPPARVQRQSANEGWRGHIVPAAFSQMGDLAQSVGRLERAMSGDRARLQLASITGSTVSALSRATGLGGGALGQGAPRTGSDGWVGPRLRVPGGMFGAGNAGGGSATSNPANSAASAAMLDAIAGTESGKAGYDAVLGNGKYGTPSKPVSTMTLDEAFAFGRTVRARHGSSSALGRYQIVGNTMRAAQRALGLDGSTVFDAATQDRMARWIARSQGLGAWEGLKGNPRAMAAAQAAMAQGGAKDVPAGAAGVASSGSGGQFDGLRVKGGQATAGGGTAEGVTDLARAAQADLPGGVKHFGAFNDRYHQGTGSKHALGLAFDTTLLDPSKSAAAAEAMRAKLRAAGLSPEAFKVIDEYRNPSARSTGGHLHTQFNSREAAERYHRFVEAQGGATVAGTGFRSTAWKKAVTPSEAASAVAPKPTADELAKQVKPLTGKSFGSDKGGAGSSGAGTTIHAPVTINAANQSPAELAGTLQRHVAQARSWRAHDMEPELT